MTTIATVGSMPTAVSAATAGAPMAAAVAVEDSGVATTTASTPTTRIMTHFGRSIAPSVLESWSPTPSSSMMDAAASAANSEMPTVAKLGRSRTICALNWALLRRMRPAPSMRAMSVISTGTHTMMEMALMPSSPTPVEFLNQLASGPMVSSTGMMMPRKIDGERHPCAHACPNGTICSFGVFGMRSFLVQKNTTARR